MIVNDNAGSWFKARSSNDTSGSFGSRAATTTAPTVGSSGVISPGQLNGAVARTLKLVFYGAGSDNDTFDARLYGVAYANGLYVYVPLLQVSCTLSAAVGVASATVTNSERFADTIATPALGQGGIDVVVTSPANDTPAHLLVDVQGFSYLALDFDMTGATSGNALGCWL